MLKWELKDEIVRLEAQIWLSGFLSVIIIIIVTCFRIAKGNSFSRVAHQINICMSKL